ncbi:MAG: PorP/SprF family type IX secretion system membrane protein [Saprospiraceae bacterium]|nr:PorP/SprF family type IX secretion system membrane protein [Saprospiraceae bacterium]
MQKIDTRYRLPILSFLLIWVVTNQIIGQQAPQYTMNMLDKYRNNPAYGGMDASLSVTGALKSQWEIFPGAPKFQHITAHMPLYIASGGVGVQFYHDQIGVEESVGFQASYNYVFETSFGILSAGFSAGLLQKRIDGGKLRTRDGIYEGNTIIHNDPILSSTIGSGMAPTTSLGVYFANDFLEAGIAIDQLVSPTITLNNAEETSFKVKRTISAFAEYGYTVNDWLQLYPSLFVKTDGIQTQLDVSTRFDYQTIYFGGLTFRGYSQATIDALAFFVGARVSQKVSLAYGYDITLSRLRNYTEGTHEIVVHYNIGKTIGVGKPERIIYNPRY